MMMTIQEVVNKSVAGLASQRFKQALKYFDVQHSRCSYRSSLGLKCAIGHLIPDELYQPEMENKSIYYLLDHYANIKALFDPKDKPALRQLQECHDFSVEPNIMREKLQAFIKDYDLEMPVELQDVTSP